MVWRIAEWYGIVWEWLGTIGNHGCGFRFAFLSAIWNKVDNLLVRSLRWMPNLCLWLPCGCRANSAALRCPKGTALHTERLYKISKENGTRSFFVMDLVQRTQCHHWYISISFNKISLYQVSWDSMQVSYFNHFRKWCEWGMMFFRSPAAASSPFVRVELSLCKDST